MRWMLALLFLGCVGLESTTDVTVYPNPCYGEYVVFRGDVAYGRIEIYNARGTLVRTLVERWGETEIVWDTRDEGGDSVPSGTYIWRYEGPGGRCSGRVVIVR